MRHESQAYAEARLSDEEGRALWLALYCELDRRRLMAISLTRSLLRLGILFFLLSLALWSSWFASSWLQQAIAWVLLALLLAQFAFVGHDAGHGSTARTPALNRALGQLAMTLVTGLGFSEWTARHRAHHRFCQDEAQDPDMAVGIVASLTVESGRRKDCLGRFMTRHQAVHLWLLSVLFGHSQRHRSQAAVAVDPRRYTLDAAMLLLHITLWFGIPCALLEVPFLTVFLAYAIPATVVGPYFAAVFWVNHIGMPLVRNVERFTFFEHQVITSRTIVNPPAWDWVFGGLNFQIEHHLFPQVPSWRLPALQAVVREHFSRHGIVYNGVSWREAIGMIAGHLRHVARTV